MTDLVNNENFGLEEELETKPKRGRGRPRKGEEDTGPKQVSRKRRPMYVAGKYPLTEAVYNEGHAGVALEMLENGYFDYQIAASFGIHPGTLCRWKNEHPDFKKAWEIGEAACHAFWTNRLREQALSGKEEGFKSTMAILNNRFSYAWGQGSNVGGANSVQNINIKTMNVVDKLPTSELLAQVNAQFGKYKALKVIGDDIEDLAMPQTLDVQENNNG